MIIRTVGDFEQWREVARQLLASSIPPEDVAWRTTGDIQSLLPFEPAEEVGDSAGREATAVRVPAAFVELGRHVAAHRDPRRWQLLYRVLWRIARGQRDLLSAAVDDDVHALQTMDKAVRKDIHKMHALVRFSKQQVEGHEEYLAYYRPDHHIVRLAAPFFAERFSALRWTIFGPDETVTWDGQLRFLPGIPLPAPPADDDLARLWRQYYSATFNPSRMNVPLMRREMPQRFWRYLPESAEIQRMVAEAPARSRRMVEHGVAAPPKTAAAYLPAERDLESLAEAARHCQGCPLYQDATQTVFGEGRPDARVVFIGEQPGDQEDLAGRPFLGPAGQLFDNLLTEAGIDRQQAYVTNTVKHFKWIPRGKRRIHAKPSSREIFACRPWLEAELTAIQPEALVLLGATAAQAILGPQFRIQRQRGQPRASEWSPWTIATYHPSAILRAADAAHAGDVRAALLADLRLVAEHLAGVGA